MEPEKNESSDIEIFIQLVEEQFKTAQQILTTLQDEVSPPEASVALMIALLWVTKAMDVEKEDLLETFGELWDRIQLKETNLQ